MGQVNVDLFLGNAQDLRQVPGIVGVLFKDVDDFLADGGHSLKRSGCFSIMLMEETKA